MAGIGEREKLGYKGGEGCGEEESVPTIDDI